MKSFSDDVPASMTIQSPCLNLNEVVGCEYLHYPWDGWERWAIARGLEADLAGLGRAVIREASQHCWEDRLPSLGQTDRDRVGSPSAR